MDRMGLCEIEEGERKVGWWMRMFDVGAVTEAQIRLWVAISRQARLGLARLCVYL